VHQTYAGIKRIVTRQQPAEHVADLVQMSGYDASFEGSVEIHSARHNPI
jgi:hypothetical protein